METREKENPNAKIYLIGIGEGGKSPLSFVTLLSSFSPPSFCVLFSYLLPFVTYLRAGYGFTESFFLIFPALYLTGHHILFMLLMRDYNEWKVHLALTEQPFSAKKFQGEICKVNKILEVGGRYPSTVILRKGNSYRKGR